MEETMMNNELVENTTEGLEDNLKLGTALVVIAIGAGVTLAGIAIGKAVKKAIANRKAKKEEAQTTVVYDEEVIEDSDDEN